MSIHYSLRIVGGAWDGAPGLAWIDDGEHPLPDGLRVGLCPEGRHCGTSLCRPAEEHASYWLVDEEGQPPRLTYYEKQDEHVRRNDAGELRGIGVYAIGGLVDPRSFGELARVPADDGLVTALVPPVTFAGGLRDGRHDRGWPR